MARSITRIPPTRAGSITSGTCTSGWTARPWVATRTGSGGSATMNTPPRLEASDRALIFIAALVFVASAAVTVAWCGSMSDMPGMEMPGGWTMSMAWMRMPGQSWAGATATFLGMWVVMMVAMMLPALLPMLTSYRRALGGAGARASLTATVAVGYFAVWTLAGLLVFPLGVLLAEWS